MARVETTSLEDLNPFLVLIQNWDTWYIYIYLHSSVVWHLLYWRPSEVSRESMVFVIPIFLQLGWPKIIFNIDKVEHSFVFSGLRGTKPSVKIGKPRQTGTWWVSTSCNTSYVLQVALSLMSSSISPTSFVPGWWYVGCEFSYGSKFR